MDNKCVKVGTEEKGSHETIIDDFNNNSGVANLNDDNQILAAIMASLQDAEDAIVMPEQSEKDDISDRQSVAEETVEITQMNNLETEKTKDFNFGENAFSPHLSQKKKVGNKKQPELTQKAKKRKKSLIPDKLLDSSLKIALVEEACIEQAEPDNESLYESFNFSDTEDHDMQSDDSDYKPGAKVKSKPKVHLRRSRRSSSNKIQAEAAVFTCTLCNFKSEILGGLKFHQHSSHEGEMPSYLDMAEAAIADLEDGAGVVELSILKEVLFEHFDKISEDKATASRLVTMALKGGVKLRRLQVSRKGKGVERFNIASKEMMKVVIVKWRNSRNSVEFSDSSVNSIKNRAKSIEQNLSKFEPKVATHHTKLDYDSDIAVLDESLTSKTKLRLERRQLFGVEYYKRKKGYYQTCKSSLSLQVPLSPSSESEEDDQLLTCSVCFCSFWYEHQTVQHMKTEHPLPDGGTVEKDINEEIETVQKVVSKDRETGEEDVCEDSWLGMGKASLDGEKVGKNVHMNGGTGEKDVRIDDKIVEKDVSEDGKKFD